MKVKSVPFIPFIKQNKFLLIFIVFIAFNFLTFYLIFSSSKTTNSFLTDIKGDALTYIEMSENMVHQGTYGLFDEDNGEIVPTTIRMPGFLIIYGPLSYLFGKGIAVNLMLIIQVLLSAGAKTLIIKLLHKHLSTKVFIAGILLLIIGGPLTQYNNILYTESITASLLTFVLYFLLNDLNKRGLLKLIFAGTLFSLCVFLRPYVLPLYLPFAILIFSKLRDLKIVKIIFYLGVFASPFVVLDSIWIWRNFKSFDEFIPLETSFKSMPEVGIQTRQFIKHYGGEPIEWDAKADGTWFEREVVLNRINVKRPDDSIFPDYIFENGLTIDSLRIVQHAWQCYDNDVVSADSLRRADASALLMIEKFDSTLKNNHPFRYYVLSRLISVRLTYYQPNSNFKSVKYPLNVILVFINALVSYILLTIGGVFILLYFVKSLVSKEINTPVFLFSSIAIIFMVILNLILFDHEVRRSLVIYFPIVYVALYGYNELAEGRYCSRKLGCVFISILMLIGVVLSAFYTIGAIVW